MNCSRCGHENPDNSRFCAQCGNQLERTCPVCSAAVGADDRFCSNCGTSLTGTGQTTDRDHTEYVPEEMLSKITEAQSGHAMRGERRTVTMLFADIKGSTAVAETLDPEDWAEIINGAFEHLIAPVYRYEGTLARLQGDAVLAFFGAPIAHEDDPVRAVRAGLEIVERLGPYKEEMQQRWDIPIDVRVGINTGLVVVGAVGSDLKVEYTALGDAVNVAARMEQTAEPGTVRVTDQTWALVSDHFDGEELGPVEAKGKSEPVPAVRVIRYIAVGPEPFRQQPLVGRTEELQILEDLRERLARGAGWIASIMGEAGLGKTRLLEEFRGRTLARDGAGARFGVAEEMAWMSSYSQSYDSSVPYSTIRDLLVRWWGLDTHDHPYRMVEEIAESVLEGVPDAAVYLGYVAGTPLPARGADLIEQLEPPVLHRRARETVISYLAAEAARRPVVIALEDTHWADSMSLTFIDDLMQVAEKEPLGLLLSMRPYRDEPIWRTHEVGMRDHPHRYRSIDLSLLPSEAASDLLGSLLEDSGVSDETRQNLLDRAEGNPLFIEQMARAIREGGDESAFTVPTGLTTLLTARLDRLDERAREVAQAASVIGSEFRLSGLSSLLGEGIDLDRAIVELLRRGIFVERDTSSGVLAFKHALIQDASYSTMLLRTRRELHRRVAEYLAGASPDSSQEIAHHFVESGSHEAAFPYLIAAGEQSSRSMALADAIRFYTTALENIPPDPDPELVVKAHDGLGVAYSLIPDLSQSEAAYQALADYADSTGRPSAKVKALNRLALNTVMLAGNLSDAHGYLDDAYTLAKEVGDEVGLAEYHMNACVISGFSGDLEASVHHDEETAKQGTALGIDEIRIEGLVRLATNAAWLMDFDKAEQAVEDAVSAAREAGDEARLALVQVMGSSKMRMREGDTDSALQLLLESEETLTRYPSFYEPFSRAFAGTLLYDRGDIEPGIARLVDLRREVIDQGMNLYIALTSATLVRMYGSLQLGESVPELRSSALEAVQAPLGNYLSSTVWADLGYANLAAGEVAAAEQDFASGLAASSATQYWERPRLLIGSALGAIELGQHDRAHGLLDEAQAFLLEKEIRLFDGSLGHARGKLLLSEDRPVEASEQLGDAFDTAMATGLRPLAVQIAVTAAGAAVTAGDSGRASEREDTARSLVDEIAGAISDGDLRTAVETLWLAPLDHLKAG